MAQRKLEALTDDELFGDWVEWIKKVENELIELSWNRRMFRDVSRVFQHNPHLREVGGFVYEWLRLNYIAGASMSFRREVDRAKHLGLVHLLAEIAERPRVLSRGRHHEAWGGLRDKFEDILRTKSFEAIPFVRDASDPMKDHIDPEVVRADVAALRVDTEVAQDYVEQTIAHRTRGDVEIISFAQFNSAMDALTPIFQKYYARLTLSSMLQLEPVPQYNTHEPFTFPWDVTCDRLWKECRGEERLPWDEIREVYHERQ